MAVEVDPGPQFGVLREHGGVMTADGLRIAAAWPLTTPKYSPLPRSQILDVPLIFFPLVLLFSLPCYLYHIPLLIVINLSMAIKFWNILNIQINTHGNRFFTRQRLNNSHCNM